jgi:hypothetical protein
MEKDKELLICSCGSLEHQIFFWQELEEKYPPIYAEVYLCERNFFRRLVYGIKYIFGYKCRYGAWEEFLFDDKNIDQLKNYLNSHFKKP